MTIETENVCRGRPGKKVCCYAILVSLVFLFLYVLSASPTVIIDHDDSALFQTVGVCGGIPHQPYPFWCILSKSFSLLPIGEPAFRITLLSIIFASSTIGATLVLLFRLTNSLFASVVASAALGLSLTFWQSAVVAEVYSLNAFLLVIFAHALVRLRARFTRSGWFLSVLAFGFCLSHHQTNIALMPGVLLLLCWNRRELREHVSGRYWLATLCALLLPFTLYLYTWVVDQNAYPVNWLNNLGQYRYMDGGGDPAKFGAFFERMRFQLYVGRFGQIFPSPMEFAERMYHWCGLTGGWEFPAVGALIITWGFVCLWRRDVRLSTFCLLVLVPYVAVALIIFRGAGMQKYSIPAYIVLSFYLAEGFAQIQGFVAQRWRKLALIPAIIAVLVIALPVLRYSILRRSLLHPVPLSAVDAKGQRLPFVHLKASNENGRIFGEEVARNVSPGTIIFGDFCSANTLFYYKFVVGTLQGVDVFYVLPRKEYVLDIIREKKPSQVYFTLPPGRFGFTAVDSVPVGEGRKLFKVSVGAVDPGQFR